MAQNQTHDLRSNIGGGVSIAPGSVYDPGSDTDGSAVDCRGISGPIQALCQVGADTGSPSAFSVNFELWESDASDGSNATKCENQTEVTLTAENTQGFARANRKKRYVLVKAEDDDSSITAGTDPTVECSASVLGQKERV